MNYQKIYENLILNAKLKDRIKVSKKSENYVYYENHHIIPRCLDGLNDKNNLVLLTAREHYICHKLLTLIHKGNRKIAMAFFYMTFDKRGNRNVSSRDYAYAKELIHSTIVSIETREKQSNARKGKNTWMKDKKHTDESIEKIREARKKQKPWNKDTKGLFLQKKTSKGQNHSQASKDKMSLSHTGVKRAPHSEETKKKMSEAAKHRKCGILNN
jgi:hypothetical protein